MVELVQLHLQVVDKYTEEFGVADTLENYSVARKEYYKSLSTFDAFKGVD